MTERRLFLFVEGNDDERFFLHIIVPLLLPLYRSVHVIKFACMKRANVCRLVRSIRRMNDEYIVFSDIDQEAGVRAKKHVLMERFCVLDAREIVVIIQEIESWYLAGLDDVSESDLGIPHHPNTDHITKEYFNNQIPRRFASRIAFMLEILSRFSIPVACGKNNSFRYFMSHYHVFSCRPGQDDRGGTRLSPSRGEET
ncbi:MAG: hypothetical protein NQU46_08515 [Methanolinea sp.]|nr:hypothetical protein [Methanolinea sp.]